MALASRHHSPHPTRSSIYEMFLKRISPAPAVGLNTSISQSKGKTNSHLPPKDKANEHNNLA